MSFKRILCPVDFSPQSGILVRHALGLAASDANVLVLHAIEPLLLQAATITGREGALRAELTAQLQSLLDNAAPLVGAAPSSAVRIVEGEPHTAILAASVQGASDVVVMGTHGAGGLAKVCFGSTLERVLRGTTVPVLAVPPRGPGLLADRGRLAVTNVVAAVDFDRPSMAAACAGASYARQFGARLTLLHVMPEAPFCHRWQEAIGEQHSLRRERAAHELALLADELANGGPPTSIVVLDGAPWECIASYAPDHGGTLVVMGLRDQIGRAAGRPGAVAYRVLSAGVHPVLVVPSTLCAQAAA